VRFWLGAGTKPGSLFFIADAVLTTGFGFWGLWLLLREKRWSLGLLLATPLVFFPIPYYITHAEFRYRLVIDAVLTLLGAYAVVSATTKSTAPRSLRVG
jgi:hypothetical protein